jgi:hypothetical protein
VTEPDQTHPDQTPKGVDLKEAGVAGWFFVLEQIKEKRAALDEAEEQAQEQIKQALGDKVDGLINGEPVVRWLHTAAPRRFNKKALEKDHPDIAAKYTTFGAPGRRFELVKPKGSK